MPQLDNSQKDVVFCSEKRLFVEAPAGYGKTTVMVEKLISDIRLNRIPYPKRALALTFSVNAARKMRNDIRNALAKKGDKEGFERRIDVFNYHALSRRIIMRHGYSLIASKIDFNGLDSLEESDVLGYLQKSKITLSKVDNDVLISLKVAVDRADWKLVEEKFVPYCDLVLGTLIPNGCITYNAILLLAIKILRDNESVKKLYRSLYSYVIVDEAQDTNILGYLLLSSVIGDQTRVCMFGDSLQRIYGFLGAIPDFVEMASRDFDLKRVELDTNHRFIPGSPMQLLDRNIRANIRQQSDALEKSPAKVPFCLFGSIDAEIAKTCDLASAILSMHDQAKIAVLVHSRGFYAKNVVRALRAKRISYFNGLFLDNDVDFISFNKLCLDELNRVTNQCFELNFKTLDQFVSRVKKSAIGAAFEYCSSYCQLIDAFCAQIKSECAGVPSSEKYQYVRSVFENRSLRHAIAYLDVDVIVTTMHSSKGLEWDYVIIPEMMQWISPSYRTCGDCCGSNLNRTEGNACYLLSNRLPSSYIDELCVFYVAVTRARRSVILFATTDRVKKDEEHKPGLISCFATLPGIELFKPTTLDDIILLS